MLVLFMRLWEMVWASLTGRSKCAAANEYSWHLFVLHSHSAQVLRQSQVCKCIMTLVTFFCRTQVTCLHFFKTTSASWVGPLPSSGIEKGNRASVEPAAHTWTSSSKRPSTWLWAGVRQLNLSLNPASVLTHCWDKVRPSMETGLQKKLPWLCINNTVGTTALTAPRHLGALRPPREPLKPSDGGCPSCPTPIWAAGSRSSSSWLLLQLNLCPTLIVSPSAITIRYP